MPSEPRVFSLTNRRTRKATVSTIKPKRVHDLNFRDSFKGFDDGDAYLLGQSLFGQAPPSQRIIAILLVPGSRGFDVLWSLRMTIAGFGGTIQSTAVDRAPHR
jgi:hypothetical protein